MSVPTAYLSIVLIWSTTPLAIQWSSEDVGFLFGLTARMSISAVVCLLLLLLLRQQFQWNGAAKKTYLASGLGLYGAMMAVYYGAQFISSGLISVIYGLMPIITSLMAIVILREPFLSPAKLLGSLIGLAGLLVIFNPGTQADESALLGIALVFLSVVIHVVSMLWIKRIGTHLSALSVTTGGLWVAVPLYLISWLWMDGVFPDVLSERALAATLYLALVGSVLGFILFYYVLKRVSVSAIAVITLLTPVIAIAIGHWLNDEALEASTLQGAALVLFGLSVHNWGGRLYAFLRRRA